MNGDLNCKLTMLYVICILFLPITMAQYPQNGTAIKVENPNTTLRFVHALWRHGDRTPAFKTFPTDHHNQAWTWPEGWGELTKVGMRQAHRLGTILRKRYIDAGFLSRDYNSTEIYVRSTSFNRTLMTALSVMAGMYPPIRGNEWMEEMTWQPIPVHSTPRMYDPLLWTDRPCPKVNEIFEDEILHSPPVQRILDENKDFLNFLRNVTGLKLKTLNEIRFVYDPLNCEFLHNRTWPPWVTREIFDKIVHLFNQGTTFYSHDVRLQRLRGGLLIGEIATRFYNKAKNSPLIQPPTQKWYGYSAHDTTLISQLEILGTYEGIMPGYSSVIFYELHEKTPGKFTVEVYYSKGPTHAFPVKQSIQGCGEVCDVETFYKVAKNLTPDDWFEDCGLGFQDPS